MQVLLSSALHAQLLSHAAAAHPAECCGLVFGDDGIIADIQATANVSASPECAFEIDPAALIAAERAMRQGGARLIGHYHSHPNGRAEPSVCDAASAAPDGRLWLIIAAGGVTAWRAKTGGALMNAFDPVDLMIIAPPG